MEWMYFQRYVESIFKGMLGHEKWFIGGQSIHFHSVFLDYPGFSDHVCVQDSVYGREMGVDG